MLRHIWEFIVAVLRSWGVLTTGGFVVALIGLWEHLSGRPIAGWPLWIAVALSLVCACFSAWRKERLTAESLTAPRPDFIFDSSQITIRSFTDSSGKPFVQVGFLMRFINKGKGTAYNLSSKIYACWINDVPRKAELADSTPASVDRTMPEQAKSVGFAAERYTKEDSGLSVHLNPNEILLILVEIRFRQRPDFDSPIYDNEPIWKMWDPRIPGRLCDATENDVRVAKEAIDALKDQRKAHPSVRR
jgi:hypothetical protein